MSSQVAHSTSNFSALSSSRPQNVAHKNCLAQNLPQKNCLLKSSLSKNIAPSTSFHHKMPCPKSSPPDPKQYIGPRCVSKSRSPSSSMVVLLVINQKDFTKNKSSLFLSFFKDHVVSVLLHHLNIELLIFRASPVPSPWLSAEQTV